MNISCNLFMFICMLDLKFKNCVIYVFLRLLPEEENDCNTTLPFHHRLLFPWFPLPGMLFHARATCQNPIPLSIPTLYATSSKMQSLISAARMNPSLVSGSTLYILDNTYPFHLVDWKIVCVFLCLLLICNFLRVSTIVYLQLSVWRLHIVKCSINVYVVKFAFSQDYLGCRKKKPNSNWLRQTEALAYVLGFLCVNTEGCIDTGS